MKYSNFLSRAILALLFGAVGANAAAQCSQTPCPCSERLITNVDFTYAEGGAAPLRWNVSQINADGFQIDEGSFAYVPTGNFSNQNIDYQNANDNPNNTRQYAIVKNPKDLSTQYADIPTTGMMVINPLQGNDDRYCSFQISGLKPGNTYTVEIKMWNVLSMSWPSSVTGNCHNWCNPNDQINILWEGNGNNAHDGQGNTNWSGTNGSGGWSGWNQQIPNVFKPATGGAYATFTGTMQLGSVTSGFTFEFFKKTNGNFPMVLGIEYIKVYGCQEEAIITSTGTIDGGKVCETSELKLTAQGLGSAGYNNYTWKQTVTPAGGSATTTVLPDKGKTIAVTTPADKDTKVVYEVTGEYNSKTITLITQLCCYDIGNRIEVLNYSFPIQSGCTNTKSPRGPLNGTDGVRIDPKYHFKCTGPIDDENSAGVSGAGYVGEYAVILNTYTDTDHFGGWRGNGTGTDGIGLKEHSEDYTGETGTGMLCINAAKSRGIFFEYDLPEDKICSDGSSYQFSAWYASADPQGADPCNIIFQLVEINGAVQTAIDSISTGNYGYNADWNSGKVDRWKQTTMLFTTQPGRKYMLRLINKGGGGVAGNDVLIDDILITRCLPKIDFYPDGSLASASELEVCTTDSIEFNMEVPQNAATPHGNFGDLFPALPGLYFQLQVCDNYNEVTEQGTWASTGNYKTLPGVSAPLPTPPLYTGTPPIFMIAAEENNKWYRVKITNDPATVVDTNDPSTECGKYEYYTRMFRLKLTDALDISISPASISLCGVGDTLRLTGSTTETDVEWGWKYGSIHDTVPYLTGYSLSADATKKQLELAYADSLKGDYYFIIKKDDCRAYAKADISTTTPPKVSISPMAQNNIYCIETNTITYDYASAVSDSTTTLNWSYALDGLTATGDTTGTGLSISLQPGSFVAERTTAGEIIYTLVPVRDGCVGDTVSYKAYIVGLAAAKDGLWPDEAAYGDLLSFTIDTTGTALATSGSLEYVWERRQTLPLPVSAWTVLTGQTTATLTDTPDNGSGTYEYRATVKLKEPNGYYGIVGSPCANKVLTQTVVISNLRTFSDTISFCPGDAIAFNGHGETVNGAPLDEWVWWKEGTTPPTSGSTNPADSLLTITPTAADSATTWYFRIFKAGEYADSKLLLLKRANYQFTVADNPVVACKDASITLTATANTASAAAPNKSYNWDNGGYASTDTYSLPTTATGTGLSFTVKGKADDFCETSVTVNYEVVELLASRASAWETTVLENESLSLDLTTTGSTVPTNGSIGVKWEKSTNPASTWTTLGETGTTLTDTPNTLGSCYRATVTLYRADNTAVCDPIDTIVHCVDVVAIGIDPDTVLTFCAGDTITLRFAATNIDGYFISQTSNNPGKVSLSNPPGDTIIHQGLPRLKDSDDGTVWYFKAYLGTNWKERKYTLNKNKDYAFTVNPDKVYTCTAAGTTTITAINTNSVAGAVYEWEADNGQTGASATFALNTGAVACGKITVTGRADSPDRYCPASKEIPYLINDLQVSAITNLSGNNYICKGSSATLSVNTTRKMCPSETFEIEWQQKLPAAATWTSMSIDANSTVKTLTPSETTQYQVIIRSKQGATVVCEKTSATYTLNVIDVKTGADELDKSICSGNSITLTGTEENAKAWYWHDADNNILVAETSNAAAKAFTTPVLDETTPKTYTYYFVAVNNDVAGTPCKAEQRFDVLVKPSVLFDFDPASIEACKNDPNVLLQFTNQSPASGISYTVNGVSQGTATSYLVPTGNAGSGLLTIEASANNYCPAKQTVPYIIDELEISEIFADNNSFCTGNGYVQLWFNVKKGNYTDLYWSVDGIADPNNTGQTATFTLDHTTTYSVYAENDVCKTPTESITIREANAHVAIKPRDFSVCEGDWTPYIVADTTGTGKLIDSNFYISWDRIIVRDTIVITQFIDNSDSIRQRPTETTTYRVTAHHAGCNKSDQITVSIDPLPTVKDVQNKIFNISEYMKEIQTTFIVDGTNDIIYCVDDTTIFATLCQDKNIFIDLSIGSHTLYVEDSNGCKTKIPFTVPEVPLDNIPKFFTPNGDGLHDTWYIPGIHLYNPIDLRIYDRFGKELEKVTSTQGWKGWEGKYLNKKLPSEDYWYVLTLNETGKKYIGHFTLINTK